MCVYELDLVNADDSVGHCESGVAIGGGGGFEVTPDEVSLY